VSIVTAKASDVVEIFHAVSVSVAVTSYIASGVSAGDAVIV